MSAIPSLDPTPDLLGLTRRFQKEFAHGLAGNISLRWPGQDRLIIANTNPPGSGEPVVVDFTLQDIQGELNPGLRDVVQLHIAILKERPQAQAVIHLHTPYLTGYAVAGRPLPNQYIPLIGRHRENVPVSKWGARHEAQPLHELLAEHPDASAALLSNHGPFVWGASVLEVVNHLIALEESAHVFHIAEQAGRDT